MSLSDDQKYAIVVNILTLVPALIKGVTGAVDIYNKMVAAAKDGISPEELAQAVKERDEVLDRLIAETEAS